MTLQAIEFTASPHNGVIELPEELKHVDNKTLRVIVLIDSTEISDPTPTKFSDLTEFRSHLPPARTPSPQLIRELRGDFSSPHLQ